MGQPGGNAYSFYHPREKAAGRKYQVDVNKWPYNYPGGVNAAIIKAKTIIDYMHAGESLTIKVKN